MKSFLKMPETLFVTIVEHLLPKGSLREEAAFLFVTTTRSDDRIEFEVIGHTLLLPSDFETQGSDFLELSDETRSRLIKTAHDLKASLVEMHSHPGPFAAAFSLADRMGLKDTVPHMQWRLQKRPYIAIVVAKSGFDALVWIDDPKIPVALSGLLAGQRLLRPTNRSLEGWA
jgi:proteasome lid subunit RPN8/RPN11